ncbi:hypothetical protein JDM601_0166 [Mycolicibacter sinensis]|uniref:Uncharacterized protein n=1 Tax=Mycolicibacter sinensis (strain JDM601) TaxID=875328 RepID=F5YXW6_MYCSD|nr:hypothetical protein JDM601_0166 [Mycolicibacter sinensis]
MVGGQIERWEHSQKPTCEDHPAESAQVAAEAHHELLDFGSPRSRPHRCVACCEPTAASGGAGAFSSPLSWSDAVREPHCDQADVRSGGGVLPMLTGWRAVPPGSASGVVPRARDSATTAPSHRAAAAGRPPATSDQPNVSATWRNRRKSHQL